MTSNIYRRNHYVPQWYQGRFFPTDLRERKFCYLDLKPEKFRDASGRERKKTALWKWGTPRCFVETDLYTTRLGNWISTEIEEKFFGRIDADGRRAVDYFTNFAHPSANGEAFEAIMRHMSTQKLRTPKGLRYLASLVRSPTRNGVLMALQHLQHLHAAIWTECIWCIADASRSPTKFIVTDHPVTVYNRDCFPLSEWCKGFRDPDINLNGTHTIFPLSLDKVLLLTNLSWVRNPYGRALERRPNPSPFRSAMFNFLAVQTHRELTEAEVIEANFVMKQRAFRYIAAGHEDWLYPEAKIRDRNWRKLGMGYLFMPDPRAVSFSSEIVIGYRGGRSERYDEYGRRPLQEGFGDETRSTKEWHTFLAFQGEFARLFGPTRRGRSHEFNAMDEAEDDPEYHAYNLSLEQRYRPQARRRRSTRHK